MKMTTKKSVRNTKKETACPSLKAHGAALISARQQIHG